MVPCIAFYQGFLLYPKNRSYSRFQESTEYKQNLSTYIYNLALVSFFIIVSATMRRWILPVAVLGITSVKYNFSS